MRWKFKPFLIFCIIVIILLNISNIRGYYALDDINNETTNYVIYKESLDIEKALKNPTKPVELFIVKEIV